MTEAKPSDILETVVSADPVHPAPPPAPFEATELRAALRRPLVALDVILARKERLVASLGDREAGTLLILMLLLSSVIFTLPFAAVIDPMRAWRVSALYLGSLGICLPSLYVFSAYHGFRVDVLRYLALGLIVPATAALFVFGFFPIHWFLSATMLADADRIGPSQLALGFLGFALVAGLAHLVRCLSIARRFGWIGREQALFLAWQALLLFISWRMAIALDFTR